MKFALQKSVLLIACWWAAGVSQRACARSEGLDSPGESTELRFVSRANTAPRKVVIGSTVARFEGSVEKRLQLVESLLDNAAGQAARKYPGRKLDLMVFPEFTLRRDEGKNAAEQSVALEGPVLHVLGSAARRHRAWLVVPMVLHEADSGRFRNAAVLFNREGKVADIYRKSFPVVDDRGVFEGGVTPGDRYPVFNCDFGRLGILICWDMSYEEVWDGLAAGGAEIVALPSASPQTVRPLAQALRHHYYVVNSTPRDNVSLVDPIGRIVAQVTEAPGVLVHQVDLSYAILHWAENLRGGEALTERYGDRVGYDYSQREDTGVFWSNDPKLTIGEMIRALGLSEMPEAIERVKAARQRRQ